MRKFFAAVAFTVTLSGCASVPMGDAGQDAALKAFTIPTDRAGIYVYRNESMGAAIKMDVAIDGVEIGQTAAKTYMFTELAPGRHTIVSRAENTDTLELEAGPGSITYIWQEVKMGALFARTKLHLVDELQGKRGVQESRLAISKSTGSGVIAMAAPTSAPPVPAPPVPARNLAVAPATFAVGSRLTFRESDPFTGAASGESTFVVAAGESGRLTLNDGSIVVAMDGAPIKGVLHGTTIHGISPQQLTRGGTWTGSFRVPFVEPDVPVDITKLRSEEKVISGRKFQASRLRVTGFATRQLLQGHANNSIGAPFNGELLVDNATGVVLEATVTSRNASYAFQRVLVRVAANQ